MADTKIMLPKAVSDALARLNAAGYEAFVVGGSVRDALFGLPVSDYDLTTSASPEATSAVFAGCRVIGTGVKHGTVTVILDGLPLEITTYRTDGAYSDGRHPDSVSFTSSLEEDLARRDFTVNAMAYHPAVGLVDRFGGQRDLDRKIIRSVGDPCRRFTEDALRILRAIRFASVLSFSVEPETLAAALALRDHLAAVSAERVYAEVTKFICGGSAAELLLPVWEILAAAAAPLASYDATARAAAARRLSRVPRDGAPRYAALLWTLPEGTIETIAAGLRMDNKTRDAVLSARRLSDVPLPGSAPEAREMLRLSGAEAVQNALFLREADGEAGAGESLRLVREILARGDAYTVGMLAVSGKDLIAAGVPAGKAVGDALDALLDDVIAGRLPNDRDALLRALERADFCPRQ